LNAFNSGKSSGKEVMILQLEQIALNYSKTPEGIRAKEMLNYLKSDLSFQATDNKGNAISQQPSAPVQPNNPQNDNSNIGIGPNKMKNIGSPEKQVSPAPNVQQSIPQQQKVKKPADNKAESNTQ